jgi:hypothetical protein
LVCASHSSGNTAETREGNEKPLGNIPALKTFSLCGILAGGGSDVVGWCFGYSVGGRIIHITLKKGVRENPAKRNQGDDRARNHSTDYLDPYSVGSLPTWPYSAGWGYYPSSGLGLILIIVLILVLVGRI